MRAGLGHLGDRRLGRPHRRLGVEHLDDPLGGDRRARDHRHHERHHHDRHEDLDEVRQVGDERSDLQVAVGDAVGADPEHGEARDVDDQSHGREHRRHQPPGAQRHVGQVGVGDGEARRLLWLAHECAHDADAGDLLAQHGVDAVDARLHQLEGGHHPHDHEPEHDRPRPGSTRRARPTGPMSSRSARIDADHHRDRSRHHHRGDHHDEHLHLLHVVRDASDQRRRSEAADLAGRELRHLVEQVAPHVAPERHRHPGAEANRDDREDDLHEREGEHHRARPARCRRCRPPTRRG